MDMVSQRMSLTDTIPHFLQATLGENLATVGIWEESLAQDILHQLDIWEQKRDSAAT